MEVTGILDLDKKRKKIYIDHEYAFALYLGEVKKYHITEGAELNEQIYEEIDKLIQKRAKLRAMNLLTKKSYTEAKLRQKLKDGHYTQKQADQAIQYVKSFGYINDESYAKDYIEYHKEKDSKQKIRQKLMEKGIDKNLIESLLEEIGTDSMKQYEEEQIRGLFQKRYKGVIPQELSERNKMYQFFMRKGYSISSVKKAISDHSLDDLYDQ